MASTHLTDIRELFQLYDTNHDGNLTLNELNELLTNVARKITALPAVSSFKCSRYSLLNSSFRPHKLHHSRESTSVRN